MDSQTNHEPPSGNGADDSSRTPANSAMKAKGEPDELQANQQAAHPTPTYDSPHRRNADFETGYGDGGGTGKGIVYAEAGSGSANDPDAVVGVSDPKPGEKDTLAGSTEHNQPLRRSAS